jgi:hypothetical protein
MSAAEFNDYFEQKTAPVIKEFGIRVAKYPKGAKDARR